MAINKETYALSKAYTDRKIKEAGGTSNYNDLTHKPQINGVVLQGNKSTSDLNIAPEVVNDILIFS